jgi:glucose-1-phosphate thymidylyltransferase
MGEASITKAVILARGLGKRMREDDGSAHIDAAQAAAADLGLKAMVPVGRPFLDYVLGALADAGFRQACLVIGPEHSAVCDYYQRLKATRIEVASAIQADPLGTASAVLAAESFAAADEFLVINSDNYYPLDVLQAVQHLGKPGTVLFEAASLIEHSNIPKDRILAFASCVVDSEGFLADIVEKPAVEHFDAAKLVSMNCWRFGPDIFAACCDVPLSPRGEYELPLAVRLAIRRGMKLKTAISQSGVLDLSRRSDIAVVAERLKNVQVAL